MTFLEKSGMRADLHLHGAVGDLPYFAEGSLSKEWSASGYWKWLELSDETLQLVLKNPFE